jgi:thiol-disulfide isomerase/thioredoxin
MERTAGSTKFALGSAMPSFALKNIDGTTIGSEYLKDGRAYLVGFLCNHCPYVKGSEEMLIEIVKRHQPDGLKVVMISSNDAIQYPDDGFEKMQEKARSMQLPYPYLYDESQEVAKMFDAACTPELYLFDHNRVLVYHGTVNDSPRDASKVSKDYLSEAIVSVLEGHTPDPQFVHPIGCSIIWK